MEMPLSTTAKSSEYLLADNLSKRELDSIISERELQPFIESRLQEYLDKQEHDHYQELVDALKNNQLSMPDIIIRQSRKPMKQSRLLQIIMEMKKSKAKP